MTQLARVSEARKIELDHVRMRVTPRFEQTGSIAADTATSRLVDVETELELESQAAPEAIAKLVATAERMCFLMDVIRGAHSVRATATLNGDALSG